MPENMEVGKVVPAMILLPGSGGIAPGREHEYAAWLNKHGIAAFVVEYYEPRGLVKGCSGLSLPGDFKFHSNYFYKKLKGKLTEKKVRKIILTKMAIGRLRRTFFTSSAMLTISSKPIKA